MNHKPAPSDCSYRCIRLFVPLHPIVRTAPDRPVPLQLRVPAVSGCIGSCTVAARRTVYVARCIGGCTVATRRSVYIARCIGGCTVATRWSVYIARCIGGCTVAARLTMYIARCIGGCVVAARRTMYVARCIGGCIIGAARRTARSRRTRTAPPPTPCAVSTASRRSTAGYPQYCGVPQHYVRG